MSDHHSHQHPHFHPDEQGKLVRCYHTCRSLLTDWKFILGVTISYPLEHALWERTPLRHLLEWIGLSLGH